MSILIERSNHLAFIRLMKMLRFMGYYNVTGKFLISKASPPHFRQKLWKCSKPSVLLLLAFRFFTRVCYSPTSACKTCCCTGCVLQKFYLFTKLFPIENPITYFYRSGWNGDNFIERLSSMCQVVVLLFPYKAIFHCVLLLFSSSSSRLLTSSFLTSRSGYFLHRLSPSPSHCISNHSISISNLTSRFTSIEKAFQINGPIEKGS